MITVLGKKINILYFHAVPEQQSDIYLIDRLTVEK